jgi:hypothetical protein
MQVHARARLTPKGRLLGAEADPAPHAAAGRVEVILRLRRLRLTAAEIAEVLGMPPSTVERGPTAADFLRRAVAWFGDQGIRVERVMSDNRSCYRSVVHAAV